MTRLEAAKKIFDYIKDNGFKPINIKYGNGYFIFDKGENGVIHFNVKGLHGWKFGMWLETDADKLKNDSGQDYPAVQFFCQHELNIDKFKPSRSFFLVEIGLEEIKKDKPWEFYKIRDILMMIKNHPFVSFAMDYTGDYYYHDPYILCYLNMKFYRISKLIEEWWNDTWIKVWHGSKIWFIKRHKVVDKVQLIDGNHDGWKSYPRYHMEIHFKKISEDEAEQRRAEIKMLNRFFKTDYYKNMHLLLTRDGVDGSYHYCNNK